MKTLYFILAFLIQFIITGQNDRILPAMGGKKEETKAETAQKSAPELVSREAMEALHKAYPANQTTTKKSDSSQTQIKILLQQADELEVKEQALRREAALKLGKEKTRIVNEANIIQTQACMKKIVASDMVGRINMEKFKNNETLIDKLSKTGNRRESVMETVGNMHSSAKTLMKEAREIREEANSMKNTLGRLGMMNNAEEKEYLALDKQEGAIGLLKSTAAIIRSSDSMLANK